MKKESIKELIDLAKSEGLSALKYEDKELKISFEFPYDKNSLSQPSFAVQTKPVFEEKSVSHNTKASDQHSVNSPLVGTFYGQPAPGEPNFVKVGDRVRKGQVLCIIEAMKIMNEVESDIDGEITEILVENESLIEFGQPLFLIKK